MSADTPANVLFVVMDTVRKDHLGPYGYDEPTTPGLDDFATEATVFEQAVAPAPWTLPVHASLFTGLYPHQHGADQENPYLEGTTTLAQTLSAAGYDTACYSSNAWITPYTRLTDGFDDQDNFFEVLPGERFEGSLESVRDPIHVRCTNEASPAASSRQSPVPPAKRSSFGQNGPIFAAWRG